MSKPVKLRDIVVLGLLRQSPRYGYEIKMIIDNVMSHVIDISSGSLYYGLKKLQTRGLVDEAAVEKIGRRPERSVFEITEEGKRYLDEELPKVVFPRAEPFFPLDLALYFLEFIEGEERARRLMMRLEFIKQMHRHIISLHDKLVPYADEHQLFILVHRIQFINMERKFLQDLVGKLANGEEYKLTKQDMAEVEKEFKAFKGSLKLETVLPKTARVDV